MQLNLHQMYPAIHGWKTNTKMKKKVKLQGGAIEAEEETTRKLNVKSNLSFTKEQLGRREKKRKQGQGLRTKRIK